MAILGTHLPLPTTPRDRTLPVEPAARRWKWTGDDLIRMGEVGLLPAEQRFELLDGEIFALRAPGPLHAFVVDLVGELLELLASSHGGYAREEKPVRLSATYDPQPDVAVVRGGKSRYRSRFPGPDELLLVVEVADSSVEHDREKKLPTYAEVGVPECWIVNLPEQQVEVYREPVAGTYRSIHLYRSGDRMAPLMAPEAELLVSVLLGEETESEEA